MTAALSRRWFERPAPTVAPALLGRHLVRRLPSGVVLRARIVETEAYEPDDPASHSFGGPTPRTKAMFGPAGHLYVYRIYGLHFCLNVVTGRPGHGGAVLLRAAEPLEGLAAMAGARGTDRPNQLCRGPGRLAQAFGLDLVADGADLLDGGDLCLEPGTPVPGDRIDVSARVGISVGVQAQWRFFESGSRWVSAARRPSRPAASARPSW